MHTFSKSNSLACCLSLSLALSDLYNCHYHFTVKSTINHRVYSTAKHNCTPSAVEYTKLFSLECLSLMQSKNSLWFIYYILYRDLPKCNLPCRVMKWPWEVSKRASWMRDGARWVKSSLLRSQRWFENDSKCSSRLKY